MNTIQYSTKLTPEQIRELKRISEKTHIPQAVLVRQAISIFIEGLKEKALSLNFLDLVKKRIKEDKALLKKLASS